jgi:hypothetical protein
MPVHEFSTKLSTDLGDDSETGPLPPLTDDCLTFRRLEI